MLVRSSPFGSAGMQLMSAEQWQEWQIHNFRQQLLNTSIHVKTGSLQMARYGAGESKHPDRSGET